VGEVNQEIDQPKDPVNVGFRFVIEQPDDLYGIVCGRCRCPVWRKTATGGRGVCDYNAKNILFVIRKEPSFLGFQLLVESLNAGVDRAFDFDNSAPA
jgi:hypothetical protein